MLHDLIFALLGIEGDFVAFESKTESFVLTTRALKHLHSAEISLINSKVLFVASTFHQIRSFLASKKSGSLTYSLKQVLATLGEDFSDSVVKMEKEICQYGDLSLAFMANRLKPWVEEMKHVEVVLGQFLGGLGNAKILDVLFTRQSGESKFIGQFTESCLRVLNRQMLSFALYGEIVGEDFIISAVGDRHRMFEAVEERIPRSLISTQLVDALLFCGQAAYHLKEDDSVAIQLRRKFWKAEMSPEEISRAIYDSRNFLSQALRAKYLEIFQFEFNQWCNVYLVRDGAEWTSLLESGELDRGFNEGHWQDMGILQILSAGFTFQTDFSSVTRGFHCQDACRIVRGPVIEFGSSPGIITYSIKQFVSQGFKMSLNLASAGSFKLSFLDDARCPYVDILIAANTVVLSYKPSLQAAEAKTEAKVFGILPESITPTMLIQVYLNAGIFKITINGIPVILDIPADLVFPEQAYIALQSEGGTCNDWRFEATGLKAELDRYACFDKQIKFMQVDWKNLPSSILGLVITDEATIKYNAIWRFLLSLKRAHLEVKRVVNTVDSATLAALFEMRNFLSHLLVFVLRDIVSVELALFQETTKNVEFLSLHSTHDTFIARLSPRLFLRLPAIMDPLQACIEAIRRFCAIIMHREKKNKLLNHEIRTFKEQLRNFMNELALCQDRLNYSHASILALYLNFNDFYSNIVQ